MTENNPGEEKKKAVRAQIRNGVAALVILIVMMLWLSGAFVRKIGPESADSRTAEHSAKSTLPTAKVELQTFPLIIEQVGAVRSRSEAQVSSHLMAQIRDIRVEPGDLVHGPEDGGAPTVLATLDDRTVEAKLGQARSQVVALEDAVVAARANVQKAASDYRRYQNLLKNGATTAQRAQYARTERDVATADVARLQAQKKQSEEAAREAKVMLGYTVITAPFSGRVVKKILDVGDMAAPGRPLFFIDSPSRAEMHAVVSESILSSLQIGQQIEVGIDALHRKTMGTIREIVPSADNSTRTVLVKITLPASADLVSGMFARVFVPCGVYHALVIPARAVREVGQLYLVDTVDAQGAIERRFIRPGKTRGDLVEVLSGLKAGEEVVVP
ncbi:MAG: efflux RND transporter periplasmic adaptor subunit [Syntrophobacteraceae bacterium]|nr:efflux RND transporter periplasmic adaptor subunit [Syntrophobacteraceae bacterium]